MPDFTGYRVPLFTQNELTKYINEGKPVGEFLHAVLSNDLHGAISSADDINALHLKDTIKWVYNCAPDSCYGTEAKVLRWIYDHPERIRGPKELE